jgi:hypothetical protein
MRTTLLDRDSVIARRLTRLGGWVAEERSLAGPPWPFNALFVAALLVSPVPIAAVAFQEVTPLFWLTLIGDLVLLFGFAVATFRTPALFIGVIILWFALQRLTIALVAPHVSPDVVRLLLTYKEGFYLILLAAAAITVALRHLHGERALPAILPPDVIAVAFLGLLALHFIVSPGTSSPELTYLRRFAAPVILYLGGRLLIPNRSQLTDSVRLLILVALAVAMFGLVERFVLDVTFWRDSVDAATFYSKQVESGLLPANWTVIYRGVPDGIFIALPLEVPVRRLVSTYLEPTTLGSFLALALLLLLLAPRLGRERSGRLYRAGIAVAVLLLAFTVVATLSRGAMLTVGAGAGLFFLVRILPSRRSLRDLPSLSLSFTILAVMTLGIVLTTFSNPPAREQVRDILATRAVSGLSAEPAAPPPSVKPDIPPDQPAVLEEIIVHPPGSTAEGASKHLGGLTSGLEEMLERPLGHGLGTAGNWSRSPGLGGESTVGVLSAQLGVPGFLLFVAFFGSVIAGLIQAAWRREDPWADVTLVLAGALLGIFLVSWVSESASGLLGNAFYLLFAGWALALASAANERLRFECVPRTPDDENGAKGAGEPERA